MGSSAARDFYLHIWCSWFTDSSFHWVHGHRRFEVLKRPWSLLDRVDTPRWLGLQPGVRRISDAVPSSLCRHSQRSCRPQPRGGGGDATSRKDTRHDRWLYFDIQLRWSLLKVFFGGSPTLQWEGPKCRESGPLAADTTKSSGSFHRAACRETREAEPLARKAGNSAEMTGFTCEEILGIQWTASKGSDPKTAPRS